MLPYVAVWCNLERQDDVFVCVRVLQRVASCRGRKMYFCVCVCVAVCCSVFQSGESAKMYVSMSVCCSVLQSVAIRRVSKMYVSVSVYCSVFAVCCVCCNLESHLYKIYVSVSVKCSVSQACCSVFVVYCVCCNSESQQDVCVYVSV